LIPKISTVLTLLLISSLTAQNQLKEDDVKAALANIFDLSKDQNYSSIAAFFLNGEDNGLRNYNYNDKSEAKSVKRMAKKIKAYLDLSDSYEHKSITYGTVSNLPSADLKVNFKSGDQELTISFVFVELSGKILLSSFK